MSRLLTKNTNGNLDWTEEALDLDGDEIFLELVEVESVNGAPPPSPNPPWFSYTSSQEVLANGQRKLTVELTVVPDSLVPGDKVVFGLQCRDAFSENVRREVTLTIGEITPNITEFIVALDNGSTMVFYDKDGNQTQSTSGLTLDGLTQLVYDEINDHALYAAFISGDVSRLPLEHTGNGDEETIYSPGVANIAVWYAQQKVVVLNGNNGRLETIDLDGGNKTTIKSGIGSAQYTTGFDIDEGNDMLFEGVNTRDMRTRRLSTGVQLDKFNEPGECMAVTVDKQNQIVYYMHDETGKRDVRKLDYDDNGQLTNKTEIVNSLTNKEFLRYVPELDKLLYIEGGNIMQMDTDGSNQELFILVGGTPYDLTYRRSFTPELQ